MPIPDRELELRPISVKAAVESMRRYGMAKDAQELEDMISYLSEMTNWTRDEWLAVEFSEFPGLVTKFAALSRQLQETAIPPPKEPSSDSGPEEVAS